MQNHHLIFHDDVDGVVSASIYMHNVIKGGRYKLYPVSSAARGNSLKNLVAGIKQDSQSHVAIVDFENADQTDIFFDHHFDKSLGSEPVHNLKIHYDPSCKSAARIVQQYTSSPSPYPESFLSVVDMIDSADYETVEQIFKETSPLMMLRAALEVSSDKNLLKRCVEVMSRCHMNMHEAIYRLDIDNASIKALQDRVKNLSHYATIMGNVSLVYQRYPGQFPRYSEYYLYPNVKYAIRLSKTDKDKFQIQIGFNKWHKEPSDINIGLLLSSIPYILRGGGHFNVGGGSVRQDQCEDLIEDLCKVFNKEEDVLEKYGVDKNEDSVESKAQDMVKTGEAKSVDEAREIASKEPGDVEKKDQ